MEKDLVKEAERFLNTRHKDKRRVRFLRILAVAVVFVTIYALILPAVTMSNEVECGMVEHVHTDECWQEQLTPPQPQLTCPFQGTGAVVIHTHDSFCYDQQGELICTLEEHTAHTHGAECYREHRELICTQAPDPGHTHTAACYAQDRGGELICGQEEDGPGHTHTQACYPLERMDEPQCGLEETEDVVDEATGEVTVPGHHHTTRCWEKRVDRKLVCGQEESEDVVDEATGEVLIPGHHHSAGCWLTGDELCYQYGCGQHESQGHTHSDSCYAWTPRLICQEEERPAGHVHTDECYEITQLFVCLEPEIVPHTHEAGCYDENGVLVCQLPEVAVHQHTAECFTTPEGEPEPVRTLICGMEEHQHDERCYVRVEENEGPTFYCGLEEHIHTMPDCFFESGALSCTIKEHVHDSSCLVPQEPEETDGPEETGGSIFPETPPEGYVEADVWSFGGAMFAMSGEEETGAAGLDARVYVPEDAFGEDAEVVFVPQPSVEEDAYDAAVAALDQAGVRYDSVTAMDLSFVSMEDGEVREPELGPVYVRLTMQMELAEGEELALWHHTGGGVEKVYADIKGENGTLTVDFAANSFSTYVIVQSKTREAQGTGKAVSWGATVPPVPAIDDNEVRIWQVSGTEYRNLRIPVQVNVSGSNETLTIVLPYVLNGVGRTAEYDPKLDVQGLQNKGWDPVVKENTVTITYQTTAVHGTLDAYYSFDCWNVESDREFEITATVNGKKTVLKGKLATGHDVELLDYAANPTSESPYAFDGFGKADKGSAFIPAWNQVYQEYFDVDSFEDGYVYDIAPFEVQPKGQQPYDISGTITPDQEGEVLGGVYMMDSARDPSALCVEFDVTSLDTGGYSFAIGNDELNGKVVSDLTDETDHKTYTLYFLVRYPKEGLSDNIELKADLSLTHKGVDAPEESKSATKTVVVYSGPKDVTKRIYWASYVSSTAESKSGLTLLKNGNTATIEYSADFFCLNEESPSSGGTRRLEAIIDLSYLTGDDDNYKPDGGFKPLESGDYRFSSFKLSLVDAEGNWSWNSDNLPNVGWTHDKFGTASNQAANETIEVYGSESLTGDDWTPVATVPAAEVWAIDQDRAFKMTDRAIEGEYLRLKVVYNSKYTTALRVGYQLELKPDLLKNHGLEDPSVLKLTSWLNYLGYEYTEGSTGDYTRDPKMNFTRYPASDGVNINWKDPDTFGTIVDVRTHEDSYPYPQYKAHDPWSNDYSMRNFAKATVSGNGDVAGMLVTQALYDSKGEILGSQDQPGSLTPSTSFSKKDDVVNASEVVYSITGVVTNGASSFKDLKERRDKAIDEAEENSPYRSLKMRYYVLLPDGLTLNTDPDNGETTDDGAPKYHFWENGTTEYLSPYAAFYNGNSTKYVDKNIKKNAVETDVPVSDGKVEGWKRNSWANVSEMYWTQGVKVTHDIDMSSGQMVVFERTLGDWADYEQFNLWEEPHMYFWGRGLSFSVVPKNGVGSLPSGNYTVHFWCQYLDKNDDPIDMSGYVPEEYDRGGANVPEGVDPNTLLYIPIGFTNHSGSSFSEGTIGVKNNKTEDGYSGAAAAEPEDEYSYKLDYKVTGWTAKDVVLWCDVEGYDRSEKSEWKGTITGVDMKEAPEGTRVYVRKEGEFDPDKYVIGAQKAWLTEEYGWELVEDPADDVWTGVKSIAFSFEGKEFGSGDCATVYIKMKAPKETALYLESADGKWSKMPKQDEYKAYNEFIYSDTHINTNDGTNELPGRALVGPTEVTIKTSIPVSYELPATGGPGVWYTLACAPLLAALCLWYKRKSTGEGAVDGP